MADELAVADGDDLELGFSAGDVADLVAVVAEWEAALPGGDLLTGLELSAAGVVGGGSSAGCSGGCSRASSGSC